MTISLVKPAGWAFGEILTSAQVEQLDANAASAVDGVGGGTYAPSGIIIIGGAGLRVTSTFQVTGTFSLTGDAVIGNSDTDTLSVVATPTFEALTTFNAGIVVAADGAEIHGSSSFGSNLTVAGDFTAGNSSSDAFQCNATATFERPTLFKLGLTVDADGIAVHGSSTFFSGLTVAGSTTLGNSTDDTLAVAGPATFASDLGVNGTTSLNGNTNIGSGSGDDADVLARMKLHQALEYTFNGRIPCRPVLGGNASATYGVADCNLIDVPSGVLSADRTYTISAVEAVNGDEMHVSSREQTHTVHIQPSGGSTLSLNATSALEPSWVRFVYISGSWRAVEYYLP